MKQWTLTLYELSELENNLYINIGLTFLSRVLADKGKLKKKGEEKLQVRYYFQ